MTLARCPEPYHSTYESFPNLLASVAVEPVGSASVTRVIMEYQSPDGLKIWQAESPRKMGIMPHLPSKVFVVCRLYSWHIVPDIKIHWIGGINEGRDP